MILGRYILTSLWLNIKLSKHILKADDGTLKESTALVVVLGTYELKKLDTGKITLAELVTKAYTEEINESVKVRTSNKR